MRRTRRSRTRSGRCGARNSVVIRSRSVKLRRTSLKHARPARAPSWGASRPGRRCSRRRQRSARSVRSWARSRRRGSSPRSEVSSCCRCFRTRGRRPARSGKRSRHSCAWHRQEQPTSRRWVPAMSRRCVWHGPSSRPWTRCSARGRREASRWPRSECGTWSPQRQQLVLEHRRAVRRRGPTGWPRATACGASRTTTESRSRNFSPSTPASGRRGGSGRAR